MNVGAHAFLKPWQRWVTPQHQLALSGSQAIQDSVSLGECDDYFHRASEGMRDYPWANFNDTRFSEQLDTVDRATIGGRLPDHTLRSVFTVYRELVQRSDVAPSRFGSSEAPENRKKARDKTESTLHRWLAEGRFQVKGEVDFRTLALRQVPIENGVIDGSHSAHQPISTEAAQVLDGLYAFYTSGPARTLQELRGQPEVARSIIGEIVPHVLAKAESRDLEKVIRLIEAAPKEPEVRAALAPHKESLFGFFEQLEARSIVLDREGNTSGRLGTALMKLYPEDTEAFLENTVLPWMESPREARRLSARIMSRHLAAEGLAGPVAEKALERRDYLSVKTLNESRFRFEPDHLTSMVELLAARDGVEVDGAEGRVYYDVVVDQALAILPKVQVDGRSALEGLTEKLMHSQIRYDQFGGSQRGALLQAMDENLSKEALLSWLETAVATGKVDEQGGWKALPLLLHRGSTPALAKTVMPALETSFPWNGAGKDLSKVRIEVLKNPPSDLDARRQVRMAQREVAAESNQLLADLLARDWPLDEFEKIVESDLDQHGKLTEKSLAEAEVLWSRPQYRQKLLPRLVDALPNLTNEKNIGEFRLESSVEIARHDLLLGKLQQAETAASVLEMTSEWAKGAPMGGEYRKEWTEASDGRFRELGAVGLCRLFSQFEDEYDKVRAMRFFQANHLGSEHLEQSAELLMTALDLEEDRSQAGKMYQSWLKEMAEGATMAEIRERHFKRELGLVDPVEDALDINIEEDQVVIGDFSLDIQS